MGGTGPGRNLNGLGDFHVEARCLERRERRTRRSESGLAACNVALASIHTAHDRDNE